MHREDISPVSQCQNLKSKQNEICGISVKIYVKLVCHILVYKLREAGCGFRMHNKVATIPEFRILMQTSEENYT